MDLSPTHAHLLLNHFPTICFIVGLVLFGIGLVIKSDHLQVSSLVIIVGIAFIAIPTYVTGNAAGRALCPVDAPDPCPNPGLLKPLIDMHESAALVSLIWMELTGVVAWFVLWRHRRIGRMKNWHAAAVLVMATVTFFTVARAANLGGEIRHPEIRITQPSPVQPFARVVGAFVSDTVWVWPASETLHFVGLTLIIGVVLLIDLKVLGFLPVVPFRALDRLLPWAILGFALNLFTGIAFFVGHPYQYVTNYGFYWKLVFLMGACANTLFFTLDPAFMREGRPSSALSKILAVATLFLWVGVMYWGSMLEFTRSG